MKLVQMETPAGAIVNAAPEQVEQLEAAGFKLVEKVEEEPKQPTRTWEDCETEELESALRKFQQSTDQFQNRDQVIAFLVEKGEQPPE